VPTGGDLLVIVVRRVPGTGKVKVVAVLQVLETELIVNNIITVRTSQETHEVSTTVSTGLEFPRIVALCEYLDCGHL
jgi:hypothetical protein